MIRKIIVVTILLKSVFTFAQTTNSSPYSFFGIGDQAKLKSVEESSMGGIGAALNSEYHLSLTNPASYAGLKWTTYVFAGGNKVNEVDDGTLKQASSAASLTYIALGIPIKENQGLAFGIQLNTSVGYSLINKNFNDDDVLIETNLLTGDGGTNRVFIGYGYQFPFNLNLGVEAAYIFGDIGNDVLNRRLGVQLATKHITNSYVKGFSFKVGAHFTKNLANQLKLKIGAAIDLGYELNEESDQQLFSLVNIADGSVIPIDTLSSSSFTGNIKSPIKPVLSAGIGKDNKWFVGAEYSFRDAMEFKGSIYDEITTYGYDKSSTIAIGGFYIPKFNSISSYWNRVAYRAGFNYKKLGLVVRDTEINEYGMSFGVSLPIGLRLSNVNLGFEIGKRGTKDNNLVEENFYNFRLSLSLNDKWFGKQKIY